MNAHDLFLDQHAVVHSAAVGGNKASAAERVFSGLTDEQMRVRPREDLNSLAWLMWHIARAEDIMVNAVLGGRPQVVDDAWYGRLKVPRRDFGIGMTSTEVSEMTRQVDLAALKDYRDAVGRATREAVGAGLDGSTWQGEVTAEQLQRAGAQGAFGGRTEALIKAFTGRPRLAVRSGIALFHPAGHLGEGTTVRSAGGFGTGV